MHPCPGTAAATPEDPHGSQKYNDVRVALPAGCDGRLQVAVIENGTRIGSYDGPVSAGGTVLLDDFVHGGYRPEQVTVIATLDGWDLPTTWSFTPPHIWCTVITTGSTATCTATVTLATRRNPESGVMRDYYDVVVRTDSADFVRWEVGFQLDHAFYGGEPDSLGNSNFDLFYDGSTTWSQGSNYTPTTVAARAGSCGDLPVLRVRGNSSFRQGDWENDFQLVRNNRERHFTFVLNLTGDYDDVVYHNCWP